ncbi:MAG: hypothetical protein KBC15_01745 [Candidatus Levybacteria bacterium]|nr:hypothetical protein [Candidatus Levybacteria bacterium]
MNDEEKKELIQLRYDVTNLKIRLKRVEEFLSFFPDPKEYISKEDIDDEYYESALEYVMEIGTASPALLQRKLLIGYEKAAKLIQMLYDNGVISAAEGAKPRTVLIRKI